MPHHFGRRVKRGRGVTDGNPHFVSILPCRKSEVEYYAMLAKTGVHYYSGDNVDLGTACGKYFRVSTLSIIDPGDSDIIRTVPSDQQAKES